MKILHLFVIIGSFFTSYLQGQELPPILNFTSEIYGAANQNWSISQTTNDFIYVANSDGLLEFNGARWTLYPSPNNTIIRSVCAVEDRVYSGSYMDFGYWEANDVGLQQYTSLTTTLQVPLVEDEQFWTIMPYEDWILFQSLNSIYIYNTRDQSINTISSNNTIHKIFKANGILYFQVLGEGLYTIINGEKRLISTATVFLNDSIENIVYSKDTILIISQNSGVFLMNQNEEVTLNKSFSEALKGTSVYSAILLHDDSIMLGTIANGIIQLSFEGATLLEINQYNGLGDNTALSLFEDNSFNVWVGLDNGIDCVNLTAPILNYIDREGTLGTTYTSIMIDDYLYLGTNQGLFVKETTVDTPFELVPKTEGQVWNLTQLDGTLFCGHNTGTFVVTNKNATLIAKQMGTWSVKPIEGHPNLALQGNYNGLHILQKVNNTWSYRNKLEGFSISSRYFEMSTPQKILVSHEYKGVYEVTVDSTFTKVITYNKNEGIAKGANSSLQKYDNTILYAFSEGVFHYQEKTKSFEKVDVLSEIFEKDDYVSGKLIVDDDNTLWFFTKNYIHSVKKEPLNNTYKVKDIAIPTSLRKEMKGFENIYKLNTNNYLLGTSKGYIIISTQIPPTLDKKVLIHGIEVGDAKDGLMRVAQSQTEFEANQNYISFNYTVPEYNKFLITDYKYTLDNGKNSIEGDWTTESSISFENLKYGDYLFEVQARVNNNPIDAKATYSFTIARPWYATNLAIVCYILLLSLFFILLHAFYKKFYKKQRQRLLDKNNKELALRELASQKEIIQLKNEKLQQEIKARNRELAISTMSMIKKNKILNEFKEELLNLNDDSGIKKVVTKVNKSLNDKEDWKFFEEAFNHADKDFFKKVKDKHPQLTTNDLRLCVYLRLNLSSKEIAPLLNISPRSVEIKRYRLRKKIDLERDVNLNNYFIEL